MGLHEGMVGRWMAWREGRTNNGNQRGMGVAPVVFRYRMGWLGARMRFGWRTVTGMVAEPQRLERRGAEGWPPNTWHDLSRRALLLLNARRAYRGLPPLRERQGLVSVAMKHSTEMADSQVFAYEDAAGRDPQVRNSEAGHVFQRGGVSIAFGQRSADELLYAWMEQPDHRANLLDPSFRYAGVGVARDRQGRLFWTLVMVG